MSVATPLLRKLGKNGPSIPALGFGLMGLSGGYGPPPSDEERFEILDHAHSIGARFWDSADIYGDSEELIGKWFKRTGKRNDIFLASKFGIMLEPPMVFKGVNSTAAYCRQQCEASLKRLGVDSIDIYYIHRINTKTPIEEPMRELAKLQAEGKIKHIGICEPSSATLQRALKIAPIAAVQIEYSPFVREIESEDGTNLLKTCRSLGIATVAHSPLGRGLLTGSFTTKESLGTELDMRNQHFPWWQPENIEMNKKIVEQFTALANKKGSTAAQLALSWVLKQGDDIFAIPGTKKIKYLDQNWEAQNFTLTDAEEREIREFVKDNELAGWRSVPQAKIFSFVDTKEE